MIPDRRISLSNPPNPPTGRDAIYSANKEETNLSKQQRWTGIYGMNRSLDGDTRTSHLYGIKHLNLSSNSSYDSYVFIYLFIMLSKHALDCFKLSPGAQVF